MADEHHLVADATGVFPDPQDVFINIPFDVRCERLYVALIAGLCSFGLIPRSVLEIPPTKDRLERIFRRIQACGASIHDLSRVQLDRAAPRCPRFNMPFELGLAVALELANPGRHHWFVFEEKRHRLQKSLSDLNGFDPLIHGGTPDGMMHAITNAFVTVRPQAINPTASHMLRVHRSLIAFARQTLKQQEGMPTLFAAGPFRRLVTAAQEIARQIGL
jgi:hypothetical protein